MSSEAQIIANRRNAQKSTGPRTPEGKAVVSQNALNHGLTAANDVICSESHADFEQYRAQFLAELDPAGPMESMLAERVVALSWRLKRIARIQNQAIDALHADNTSSPLARLTRTLLLKCSNVQSPTSPPQSLSPVRDTLRWDESAGRHPQGRDALALGRMAIKDFSNARVLDRLLMYERRIEHSLYKTVLELQRLNLVKKLNPGSETPFNQFSINHEPITNLY